MYGKSFCGVRMWTMDAEWNIIQYTFDLGFTSLRYSMRGRTAEAGCCGTKMVCQTECWIRDHHRRFVPTLTHTQHTTYKIHGVKEGCFMPSGMLEGKKKQNERKTLTQFIRRCRCDSCGKGVSGENRRRRWLQMQE